MPSKASAICVDDVLASKTNWMFLATCGVYLYLMHAKGCLSSRWGFSDISPLTAGVAKNCRHAAAKSREKTASELNRPHSECCVMNGVYSDVLNTWVPQVCVLSPLLFSIYPNELAVHSRDVRLFKYEDDMGALLIFSWQAWGGLLQPGHCAAGWCDKNKITYKPNQNQVVPKTCALSNSIKSL